MSYLRVNLVDFESMQNRDDSLDRINKTASEMFPDIEMMLDITTGDKSCMTVSIYADKETASMAVDQRSKHFLDLGGMELAVAFEGDLKAFYKREHIKSEQGPLMQDDCPRGHSSRLHRLCSGALKTRDG